MDLIDTPWRPCKHVYVVHDCAMKAISEPCCWVCSEPPCKAIKRSLITMLSAVVRFGRALYMLS
jgi:hypothetical protein